MKNEQINRLVVIVTDDTLFKGEPKSIEGRDFQYIPIRHRSPSIHAVATTLATGVATNVHGIVDAVTVDTETMLVRKTQAFDRKFQAFWTNTRGTGIKIELLNWPASRSDPDVEYCCPDDVFAKAETCLDNDILGFVLPRTQHETISEDLILNQEKQLHSFLKQVPNDTSLLIIHKAVSDTGSLSDNMAPLSLALSAENVKPFKKKSAISMESVGGMIYLLANLPCPVGVHMPSLMFKPQTINQTEKRPFPIVSSSDQTEWPALITKLKETNVRKGSKEIPDTISILIRRFATLMSDAYEMQDWENVEKNSSYLIQLQSTAKQRWMHVLSLHQLNRLAEASEIIEKMKQDFPNFPITKIAESLQLVHIDPESVREKLYAINPNKVRTREALGTLGRLCLRSGLDSQGVLALSLAFESRSAIDADRAALASFLCSKDKYEKAYKVLGKVGMRPTRNNISWMSLRLKILIALQLHAESAHVAQKILNSKPNDTLALEVLKNG